MSRKGTPRGSVLVPFQGTSALLANPGHRSLGSLSPGLESRSPMGTGRTWGCSRIPPVSASVSESVSFRRKGCLFPGGSTPAGAQTKARDIESVLAVAMGRRVLVRDS